MVRILRLAGLGLGAIAPLSAQVTSGQLLPGKYVPIAVLATLFGVGLGALALHALCKRQSAALERALKESQERLQWAQAIQSLILENSPVGIAFVENRLFSWVNPHLSQLLGQSQEMLKGASTCIIFNSEEEFQSFGEAIIEPLSKGSPFSFELLSKRADGMPFSTAITGKALDPSRPDDGSIWIFEDLTARRETERALRFSEAKFMAIFDAAPVGLALLRERRFIRVNPKFASIYGRPADTFPGELTRIIYATEEGFLETGRWGYTPESFGKAVEQVGRRADGNTFPMILSASISPDSSQSLNTSEVILVAMDLTEERATQEVLRQSQAMLAGILDAVPHTIFWKDREGRFLGGNAALVRASGLDRIEDLVGKTDNDLPWSDFARRYRADDQQVMECGHPRLHILEPLTDARGNQIWLDTSKVPLRDADGAVIGVLGLFEDITEQKQAHDELDRERRLKDAIMASIPGLVYLYNEEGRLVSWNKQHEDVTGYTEEELKRITILDWYKGDEPTIERINLAVNIALAEGYAEVEADLQCKDGHRIPFYFTGVGVTIDDKPFFTGIGIDISSRKQIEEALRQSQQKLQAIFDASPFTIMVLDLATRRLLEVNPRFCITYRISRDAAIGRGFEEIMEMPLEHRQAQILCSAFHRLTDGEPVDIELEVAHAQEGTRYLHFSLRPITIAGSPCCLGMGVDITGRKQAEHRLAENQEHLEELIEQRTSELNQLIGELEAAKNTAEAATLAKSQFLANMSHEIRTPLNAVIGLTQLAQRTHLDDQQRQYLSRIQTAADALLHVINDILDFSKIEAGKLDLESVDFALEAVLAQVADVIGPRATAKGLELLFDVDFDVPGSLRGDPKRLGQILLNLCSNAVKFTESGEITVRVRRESASGALLLFSVRDTGIGMTEEQRRVLFRPFTQADASTTRRFGGTGLGLAISRNLVTAMGGTIDVESSPGRGSTFQFTVQLGLGTPAGETGLVPRFPANLRVLVVDDCVAAREILIGLVRQMGFTPWSAASSQEALAVLHAETIDLVLLDWRMPEEDGFRTAERIRQGPPLRGNPRIILVTAFGDEEVKIRAKAFALDGYLTKPVTPSNLYDAVLAAWGGASKDAARQAAVQPVLEGAQILLVEDNEFNQQVGMELLALLGAKPALASNGQEALDLLKNWTFDLILMDLQMPVLDGYETTRRIRADRAFDTVPIIAMTAHAISQERERCLELGMNDYLTKPVQLENLASTAARWISGKGGTPISPLVPAASLEIDLEAGLQNCGGKTELFMKMLHRFLELQGYGSQELLELVRQGQREEAARRAHSMISIAGMVGAKGLSDTARLFSQTLADPATKPSELLLERFEAGLAQASTSIAHFLSQ